MIDNNQVPDLSKENAVQVAALLKKFLRDMPDPLMTFKLHKLWITSQRLDNENERLRVLHLICCLLPKCNRDTMEVLFAFLKWAASFSQVDEESGSKMDIHNLATVMAPNILYAPPPKQGSKGPIIPQVDESFLAIEAVNSLIKYNENFCEVPEDLQSILTDSALHTASADMSTKEILARYGHIAQGHAQAQKGVAAADVPAPIGNNPLQSKMIDLGNGFHADGGARHFAAQDHSRTTQYCSTVENTITCSNQRCIRRYCIACVTSRTVTVSSTLKKSFQCFRLLQFTKHGVAFIVNNSSVSPSELVRSFSQRYLPVARQKRSRLR
ncbi:hypothetical protein MRB53_039186 [Persea americana]|nr:hypothetical protein MRB53_039186 [Persea americana]